MDEPLCAISILSARCRITRWVIVDEYQGGCAVAHRWSKHFTRMDDRRAKASNRNKYFAYQLILGIEVQRKKVLLVGGEKPGSISIV